MWEEHPEEARPRQSGGCIVKKQSDEQASCLQERSVRSPWESRQLLLTMGFRVSVRTLVEGEEFSFKSIILKGKREVDGKVEKEFE